ncbi:MAG: glycosyltransferase [Roseiflexaceae bacterium]|nr:glycosyltransferase [Roseiflexaceae bacterium]
MLLLVTLLFLFVVALCARDLDHELRAPLIVPRHGDPITGPLVSVIIPARDEAARIGACLESLTEQRYRSFEVLVVDDHSTDGTGAIARGFAERLPALHVLDGAELPAGWAGKCWACWQAASLSQGEWLLFLDADVVAQPDLIGALVARAGRAQLDAVTLMPLQRFGSLAERLLIPAFQTIMYSVYPLREVSDPQQAAAFFNGQAILIRREVYAESGGHEAVRGSVLEDADFGALVKAAGHRILAAHAPDLLHVRMYDSWASVSEGLGKNAVAGYRSGGWRSGWAGFRQSLVAYGWLYLVAGGVALWLIQGAPIGLAILAHGLALLAITIGVTGWLFQRRYRVSPLLALGYPFGLALYYALALRGLVRVQSGRGVVWKGRTLSGR